MEVLNNSISEIFTKYIKHNQILFYDVDNLIEKGNSEDYICPICLFLLKNPINCSDADNSHSFCKECIDKYKQQNNNNNCPTCKQIFQNKIKNDIIESLNKFSFNCCFKNEGCNKIISYSEYLNHINNCEYNNEYECQIKKYNYKTKQFEICGIKDNKTNIKNHLKSCALMEYNCIFCSKKIFQIDLEEHVKNKCKFGIIKYSNGDKYFGEKKNNMRDGYGVIYCKNGDKFEAEWKNDKIDGYLIYYFNIGDKYEGYCKNDKRNGYGIYHHSNGNIYEGYWENNMKSGYGIFYNNINQIIYEGEFKNDNFDGYGIKYFKDGKYEGKFKNNKREGYGILIQMDLLDMKVNLKMIK